ncbi:MAG: hypothetical protein M3O74_13650 [Pseudomonadota bacterium]|nr:hypothetical protein [Pseudomonadota bacterium]
MQILLSKKVSFGLLISAFLLAVVTSARADTNLCQDNSGHYHKAGDYACFSGDPNDFWFVCTGRMGGSGTGVWEKTRKHCKETPG